MLQFRVVFFHNPRLSSKRVADGNLCRPVDTAYRRKSAIYAYRDFGVRELHHPARWCCARLPGDHGSSDPRVPGHSRLELRVILFDHAAVSESSGEVAATNLLAGMAETLRSDFKSPALGLTEVDLLRLVDRPVLPSLDDLP